MKQASALAILSCMLFAGEGGIEAFQQQARSSALDAASACLIGSSIRGDISLRLVPGQGNQLKAAYECSLEKKEREESGDDIIIQKGEQQQQNEESSKSFLTRVFQKKSVPHPIVDEDAIDNAHNRQQARQQQQKASSNKSLLTRVFHQKSVPHPILDKDIEKDRNENIQSSSKFSLSSFLHNLSHPNNNHQQSDEEEAVYYPINGFRFVKGCEDALPTIHHASIRMPTKQEQYEETFGWFSPACKLDLFSSDICHNPIPVDEGHYEATTSASSSTDQDLMM